MTEPTKGPWRWGERRDYDRGAGDANGLDAAERTILSPTYSDSGIEWSNAADARLIEKAPEMLALLRKWDRFVGIEWVAQADALVAYILGEPTREEEEASTDGP